jgi:hypothetical protein
MVSTLGASMVTVGVIEGVAEATAAIMKVFSGALSDSPPAMRGAAYGLRQALDSAGGLIGPLLAMIFMVWFATDIRTVKWAAIFSAPQ